jgi:hypothetical protein
MNVTMKTCPYCSKAIQDQARTCPHCGRSQPTIPKSLLPGRVVIALAVVAVLAFVTTVTKNRDLATPVTANPGISPSQTFARASSAAAVADNYLSPAKVDIYEYEALQDVKAALQSPASAQFPSSVEGQDQWHVSRKGNIVTVRAWVDAQNGAGEVVRSPFTAQYTYDERLLMYLELGSQTIWGSPRE